jgi:hypothetical protein
MFKKKKATIIILGENWNKICEDMHAALPKEQAAQALNIIIKYTENR